MHAHTDVLYISTPAMINISFKYSIQSYTLELEDEELQKLKEFDMNIKYGPCIGKLRFVVTHSHFAKTNGWLQHGYEFTGMSRLERWERARDFSLDPPEDVRAILLQHNQNKRYSEWWAPPLCLTLYDMCCVCTTTATLNEMCSNYSQMLLNDLDDGDSQFSVVMSAMILLNFFLGFRFGVTTFGVQNMFPKSNSGSHPMILTVLFHKYWWHKLVHGVNVSLCCDKVSIFS